MRKKIKIVELREWNEDDPSQVTEMDGIDPAIVLQVTRALEDLPLKEIDEVTLIISADFDASVMKHAPELAPMYSYERRTLNEASTKEAWAKKLSPSGTRPAMIVARVALMQRWALNPVYVATHEGLHLVLDERDEGSDGISGRLAPDFDENPGALHFYVASRIYEEFRVERGLLERGLVEPGGVLPSRTQFFREAWADLGGAPFFAQPDRLYHTALGLCLTYAQQLATIAADNIVNHRPLRKPRVTPRTRPGPMGYDHWVSLLKLLSDVPSAYVRFPPARQDPLFRKIETEIGAWMIAVSPWVPGMPAVDLNYWQS